MKQLISERTDILGQYEGGSLQDMIKRLTEAVDMLPEDQRASAEFEIDIQTYAYGEYPKLFLKFKRPETDKEEKTREERKALFEKQADARDLAEFKRLQKKFK
jgi:hypothetical protein